MKSTTITGYTATELQQQFPSAFAKAHERHNTHIDEVPWSAEIFDSLEAVLSVAGVTLKDYDLGAYNRGNHIRIEMPGDDATADLCGKRAFAWLENNLFAALRVRPNMRIDNWDAQVDPATGHFRKGYKLDKSARYYRIYGKIHRREGRIGEVPSCPLTGVCFDGNYLDSLKNSIRQGCTLKEAFEGLADVYERLAEAELDQAQSAEAFIEDAESMEMLFDDDGEEITRHF